MKILTLLVASLLSLQAAQSSAATDIPAAPSFVYPGISCSQAWRNLQDQMAHLGATPDIKDLLVAEVDIISYQFSLASKNALSDSCVNYGLGVETELMGMDFSNALSLLHCSIDFGDLENVLLHARVGSGSSEAFMKANNFYMSNDSLLFEIASDFAILQKDSQNVDVSNPVALDQIKKELGDYRQAIKKLSKQAQHYKKAELKDTVNAAGLTPEEQQLWREFQSVIAKKYKTACKKSFN